MMIEPANRIERIIRFPRPLYARLVARKKATGRSINAEVLRAIERHLDPEEENS